MATASHPGPWLIHFFQRAKADDADDADDAVPALDFFETLSDKVASEIAVLDAVAQAPPPAFSGGGKREAMRGAGGDAWRDGWLLRGPCSGKQCKPSAVLPAGAKCR
ncbi:hypothetical protein [Candidatus Poriferisodalis sp.]|uniref:hypothetical protein n=1 Tax=Candidatus Poriferisodalis sp. TaxID=3101277 RepID=UPI003B019852